MSKKFKLALGVMTLVVALVFGKEGWHFYQLLAYAKETQGENIKQLVMEAKNSLTLASLQKNHAVAYNQAEGLIIYVVNGEVAEYKVDEDVSQYWDSNAPLYDVCDTAQWTLGALNRTIQKAMQKTYKRGLVVKLTRLDRMGRVKDELQNGKLKGGVLYEFEERLGYLKRDVLRMEFIVPYKNILMMMEREIGYLALFMFFLLFCVFVLFHFLREERRNGKIRNFYMRMYRHDIRHPIGLALTWGDTLELKARERLSESEKEYIRKMKQNVEVVREEVEQMIAVQVCEHALKVHFRDVDIHRLLQEWTSVEKWPVLERGEARIERDFQASNSMVKGEQDLLASLFQNLIGNAFKYGGEQVVIKLTTREIEGGNMAIEVADNGPGIPAEAVGKVFERGFRVARNGKNIPGTGWGLYMARKIVEAHGGSIKLESQEGKGSRFTVILRHKKKWYIL